MNKITLLTFIITLLFSNNIFAESEPERRSISRAIIANVDREQFKNTASLQSLNKITAKTEKLEIEVGKEMEVGKIDILIHKCWAAPLHEKPENKILLEIFQRTKDKDDRQRIFYGWMLSSSPSVSSLEHPIYDIMAIKCFNKELDNE